MSFSFFSRIAGHPLAQNERCLHMFLQDESLDRNYIPGKVRPLGLDLGLTMGCGNDCFLLFFLVLLSSVIFPLSSLPFKVVQYLFYLICCVYTTVYGELSGVFTDSIYSLFIQV